MCVSRCRRSSAKWCGLSSCRGTEGPPLGLRPLGTSCDTSNTSIYLGCAGLCGFDVIVPVVCRAKNSILYWLTDDHILYILNNIEWWEMPHLQADLDRILHPPKPSVTAKVSAAGAAAGKVVSGTHAWACRRGRGAAARHVHWCDFFPAHLCCLVPEFSVGAQPSLSLSSSASRRAWQAGRAVGKVGVW